MRRQWPQGSPATSTIHATTTTICARGDSRSPGTRRGLAEQRHGQDGNGCNRRRGGRQHRRSPTSQGRPRFVVDNRLPVGLVERTLKSGGTLAPEIIRRDRIGRWRGDLLERRASGGVARRVPLSGWMVRFAGFGTVMIGRRPERNEVLAWTEPIARQTNDLLFTRVAGPLLAALVVPIILASLGTHRFADLSPRPKS
jgi:hypothetical protein